MICERVASNLPTGRMQWLAVLPLALPRLPNLSVRRTIRGSNWTNTTKGCHLTLEMVGIARKRLFRRNLVVVQESDTMTRWSSYRNFLLVLLAGLSSLATAGFDRC